MPERPELDYQRDILHREVVGRRIEGVVVANPVLLRRMVQQTAAEALTGQVITAVSRQSHFLVFKLGDGQLELLVHPMLAGGFSLLPSHARATKDTGLRLSLDDGRDLRYRDRKQMGKLYIARAADRSRVPGLAKIGVDVLSTDFTLAVFKALARKRRDQVKLFLLDKAALDAFGNAYADEALFAAGVHPKTRVRELDEAALTRLHSAMVRTLAESSAQVRRRAPPLDGKVRDFLQIRNRKGQPCPQCGSPIRVAGVRGHDAFFCAVCQPDHKGRTLVSWRRPPAAKLTDS